jgi:hypothetical protein
MRPVRGNSVDSVIKAVACLNFIKFTSGALSKKLTRHTVLVIPILIDAIVTAIVVRNLGCLGIEQMRCKLDKIGRNCFNN